MSDSELPPLSPDLERLFASANRAPEPPELAERVRDGVERAMVLRGLADLGGDGASGGRGATASGAAKAGAAKAGAAKAASLVSKAAALKIAAVAAGAGLAIGAGAGHQWAIHEQRDVAVTDAGAAASVVAPAASPSPWSEPPSSGSIAPPTATSGDRVAPPPAATPSAARSSDAPSSDTLTGRSALRRERELIDGASGALASGNAAQALALAERHRAQFPSGQLAEEREVLAIEALMALGRSADARARFGRFQSHFQGSPATQRLKEKIDRAP